MEKKIVWDLYCYQCSLQFEKRSLYDLHLLIIHNYKTRRETVIKTEPTNIQSDRIENQELIKNVSEAKKVFRCKFCDFSSSHKGSLKRHICSVHEGKNPFKCESCEYRCSRKQTLS